MAFYEAYEKIKAALKNAKGKGVDKHLAIEIVITDEENAGICYLEVADGTVRVEPYDYFDHHARIIGRSDDLAAVLSGKLDFDTAMAEEKLFIEGDIERALEVKKIIRKPAGRKPAAKKEDAESAEAKPAPKRTRKKAAKPDETPS